MRRGLFSIGDNDISYRGHVNWNRGIELSQHIQKRTAPAHQTQIKAKFSIRGIIDAFKVYNTTLPNYPQYQPNIDFITTKNGFCNHSYEDQMHAPPPNNNFTSSPQIKTSRSHTRTTSHTTSRQACVLFYVLDPSPLISARTNPPSLPLSSNLRIVLQAGVCGWTGRTSWFVRYVGDLYLGADACQKLRFVLCHRMRRTPENQRPVTTTSLGKGVGGQEIPVCSKPIKTTLRKSQKSQKEGIKYHKSKKTKKCRRPFPIKTSQ